MINNKPKGLCVTHGLLFGHDFAVAEWTWNEFKLTPMHINSAIGIIKDNKIVGSILFQNLNGANIEISYFGPSTFTTGIIRSIARYILDRFNIHRLTIRTNRENIKIIKMLSKFGFKFEGIQKRFYGQFGDSVCFVMFKEEIIRIANYPKTKEMVQ